MADFKSACEKEEIIVNVKEKPRNSANAEQSVDKTGTHVFDGELYADHFVIEHANA